MLLLERCPVPLAMQLHWQGTVVASVCGKAALCAFVTPWHLDILLFACCWYCWASDYRKCLLWLSCSVCCTCGGLHVCIVRCLRMVAEVFGMRGASVSMVVMVLPRRSALHHFRQITCSHWHCRIAHLRLSTAQVIVDIMWILLH